MSRIKDKSENQLSDIQEDQQHFDKYKQVQQYEDSDDSDSYLNQKNNIKKSSLYALPQKNGFSNNSKRSRSSMLKMHSIKKIDEERECEDILNNNNRQDKQDQHLRKNRQSAKQCRQRKKVYITMLEKQVQDLKGQIEASKKNIRIENQTLKKLLFEISPEKNDFIDTKLQLQMKIVSERQKLKNITQMNATGVTNNQNSQMKSDFQQNKSYANGSIIKSQLEVLMDCFMYNFSANGYLKSNVLDSQLEQILRLLFEHKLFIFWQKNLLNFDNSCFDMVSLYTDNNSYNRIATLVQTHRGNLFKFIKEISQIKQQIKNKGNRMDYLYKQLLKIIGIQEILNFFILNPLYLQQDSRIKNAQLALLNNQSITSFQTLKKKVKL